MELRNSFTSPIEGTFAGEGPGLDSKCSCGPGTVDVLFDGIELLVKIHGRDNVDTCNFLTGCLPSFWRGSFLIFEANSAFVRIPCVLVGGG
jgi:hypothetical protein